ncbi:hypothetical protein [uncultured Mediterranean phage uvMED]|nr:hypothetical protein [uncultured Mediterranean phage uvMED]
MTEDKKFAEGLYVKESTVDFVKFKLSINKDQFTQWYKKKLEDKDDDWINLDIKVSKDGKWYVEENTWKPKKEEEQKEELPDF